MTEHTREHSGHTPGPWEFVGTGIRDQRGLSLASVSYGNGSVSMKIENWETIANARLIAAAPEMRDELDPETWDQMASVIADTVGDGDTRRLVGIMEELANRAMRQRALLARIEGN